MNCPECGSELLIGSEVCPICDMISEREKHEQKVAQKKKKRLIIFLCVLCVALLLLSVIVTGIIHISRNKITGNWNGNSENDNLFISHAGTYYYSTVNTLYSNNKSFGAPEVIDKTDGIISDLCFTSDSLYYVKDNKLYKYTPKTRKIKALTLVDKDFSIAGYSAKKIYCNIGNTFCLFDIKSESLLKICDGNGLFDDGKLYVFSQNSLYEYTIKDGSRRQICNLSQYTVPTFCRDGLIICYDYSNSYMMSINPETAETHKIINTADFKNISDITHMNITKDYIFLRGENGIYRYNKANNECVMLSSLGYMKYVLTDDSLLYTLSNDKIAYFSDFDGKIIYTAEPNSNGD